MPQPSPPLNVLHTSDWHLGRTLYGRRRHEEFAAFLSWLADTIRQLGIDVLLVAGDVFDTGTPGSRSQELYYQFLRRAAASCCRHVVIIAGNHDSPSFLNAPRELLKAFNIHVIGNASTPEDEVLVLRNGQDEPELIVCAVPYLRDRDVRTAEAGEKIDAKEQKLLEGIRDHYAAVGRLARQRQEECGGVPIIGMGHLFTAGGRIMEGDGVRELYVGSLAHVSAGIFPDCFSYVALGHLHIPQKVGGSETMRYSGSPLPMSFGEARQQKSLCHVILQGAAASVRLVDVPVFQPLVRITGDWAGIAGRLRRLAEEGSRSWLEIIHDGAEIMGDLRERLEDAIAGTGMELLRIRDILPGGDLPEQEGIDPGELSVEDVFERCLAQYDVPEGRRDELRHTYREAVTSLLEDDAQAEEDS